MPPNKVPKDELPNKLAAPAAVVIVNSSSTNLEPGGTADRRAPVAEPRPRIAPTRVAHQGCEHRLPSIEYGSKTVPELKELLKERRLPVGGLKADLVLRLRGHARQL